MVDPYGTRLRPRLGEVVTGTHPRSLLLHPQVLACRSDDVMGAGLRDAVSNFADRAVLRDHRSEPQGDRAVLFRSRRDAPGGVCVLRDGSLRLTAQGQIHVGQLCRPGPRGYRFRALQPFGALAVRLRTLLAGWRSWYAVTGPFGLVHLPTARGLKVLRVRPHGGH